MNLEQAKLKLQSLMNRDNGGVAQSFHLGRVGFRKHTKKYLQGIDKSIDVALEIGKLKEFIKQEETKAEIKANPRPSKYYSMPSEMVKGEQYNDSSFGWVTVIKINKNTVTIKTESGYRESRAATLIYKK